jgi:hypothetical protein
MKLSTTFPIAALALLAGSLAAQAATVVNFDGVANSYISGSAQSLSLPAAVRPGGNEYIYGYSAGTAISPGAYTGPVFHGGGWMTSAAGTPAGYTSTRVRSNYSNSGGSYLTDIEIGMTGHTGSASSGAFFVSFLKEDFTGGPGDSYFFDSTSSISMKVANGNQSEVRFAVLADGQWYLSAASTVPVANAGSPTLTLSGQGLLDSTWALWDPTGGANGRLGDLPSSFTVAGSSLQNIEGVGFYTSFNETTSNQYVYLGQFSADLAVAAVPEPTAGALSVAGLLLFTLRRRSAAK